MPPNGEHLTEARGLNATRWRLATGHPEFMLEPNHLQGFRGERLHFQEFLS